MRRHRFAAVDLGASGGRIMCGEVEEGRIRLSPVRRFRNAMVEENGRLSWDLIGLYRHIKDGLRQVGDVASIGIDTWGVDYGLLDRHGRLLAQPTTYRDTRTGGVLDEVHALVSPEELYAVTGIAEMPINTVYQLAAERRGPLWDGVTHAVLLPDLLAFWLTGRLGSEVTNASTTGLLDAQARDWSRELFERLGLPDDLFPPVDAAGSVRGTTADGTAVVTVASHDTASAVVGIPATTRRWAFISSGTWSLVGIEIPAPTLTEAGRRAGFTNEAGLDGRIEFLRNLSGFWLVDECLRTWGRHDLGALLAAAAALPAGGPRVDVGDPVFLPAGAMPERIAAAAGATMDPAETIRCILDSLADAYAKTVIDASRFVETPVEAVHIVGGGSRSDLLCQLTADATGMTVLAGPVEATAIGNVMVQARAIGALPSTLDEIRWSHATAQPPRRFEPS